MFLLDIFPVDWEDNEFLCHLTIADEFGSQKYVMNRHRSRQSCEKERDLATGLQQKRHATGSKTFLTQHVNTS
jgi:hypothetical protein